MKKLFALIFILIMILTSFSQAYAVQVLVIDSYTGEIVNQDENATSVSVNNKFRLDGNTVYDTGEKKFLYTSGTRSEIDIYCTVCDGMIVTDPVEIYTSDDSQIGVYLNGEQLPADSYSNLRDRGVYIVRNNTQDVEVFRFAIVNKVTCELDSYNVPSSFYVTEAYFNGQKMEVAGNKVNMPEDGRYMINYHNDKINKTFTLDVETDHVKPSLTIKGLNEKNIANSTVTFGETEDNSTLIVQRDGEIVPTAAEYKDAGEYRVTYYDEAGNAVTYYFKIHFFLDAGGWIYVGMTILLAAGAFVYMKYTKKKFRIY